MVNLSCVASGRDANRSAPARMNNQSRLMRLCAIGALSFVLSVFSQALLAQPTGPSFTCSGVDGFTEVYQVQSGQLRIFDPAISAYTDVGAAQTGYNTTGYNSLDNYAYGARGADVIVISSDGTTEVLYSNLLIGFATNSGDVDDEGTLWVKNASNANTLRRVYLPANTAGPAGSEVTPGTFDVVTFSGTTVGNVADVAFIQDGGSRYLVGVLGTSLQLFNLDTEVATSLSAPTLPSGAFGAAWTDSAGRLFVFNNTSGEIYELFNVFSGSLVAELVALGDPSSSNDGFACRDAPFPNLQPLAFDDEFETYINAPVSGNVLDDNGNGADEDPEGGALTVNTTPVSDPANGTLVLNSDGSFTYTPDADFVGTDTFEYEVIDPSGLVTVATVTIEVLQTVSAEAETFPAIDGAAGGSTVSVLASDTLNGSAIDPDDVTLTLESGDSELSLDTDTGVITVAPGTPAGTYTLEYTVCEDANPTNCDTVTETVTVDDADIGPTNDTLTGVDGVAGGTDVLNVFDNDRLNGSAIDPDDVTLTETVADPNGVLTLNPDGSVDVAPDTPAGTYELTYEICEILNPTNCETATVSVTVDPAPIVATAESFTTINGTTGGTTESVLVGDTLNGEAIDLADVTLTVGTSDPELDLDPLTGLITVAPGTPVGDYDVEYTVCENLNPTNCATVTETVSVTSSTPIGAANDVVTGVNGTDGGTDVVNVFDNDTLDGVTPLDPADVILTEAVADPEGVLTLNPDGSVDVSPDSPAGTYELTYQICEVTDPDNCRTGIVSVTVDPAPIVAVAETFPAVNGDSGGTTPSVLTSDTLNGVAVDPADVTLSLDSADPALSLNTTTGVITVAPGTAAGSYPVEYTVCESLNPTNCATVTETVVVEAAPIVAAAEVFDPIDGLAGGQTPSVLASDTLNGAPVDPAEVTITVDSSDPELSLDPATGVITIAPGTPAGTYSVEYTVCENLNPTNCATVTETVTVVSATIVAAAESFTTINGTAGGTTESVLTGDTLNGEAIDLADVTLTVGASDPELVLDPLTGLITVAPGTAVGDYTVEYTVCENLNPTNCSTVTETVSVTSSTPIGAANDVVTGVNGTEGATGVVNVFDNDTLDGVTPLDPADVILTELVADPESVLTLNPDGSVDVAPGTPAGTYELVYEICEVVDPDNCRSGTVSVTVDPAPIVATADTVDDIDRTSNGENVANVLDGDTLNGDPVSTDTVTVGLAPGAALPAGITLNPDGSVDVDPSTPAGIYVVEYEICEILNPTNCSISTLTIDLDAPAARLSGTVFLDSDADETLDDGEVLLDGWIVQVLDDDGNLIAETTTDANGFYELTDLEVGDYIVAFVNPETDTVYERIVDLQLDGGPVDLSLPVDPSGVLYDSITRQPIDGVLLTFADEAGNALPDVCFIDPSQQNQLTDSEGRYRFDLVPGADPACPEAQTNYQILVDAPDNYADASTVIGVQPGFLTAPAGTGPFQVVDSEDPPQTGEDTTYYLGFTIGDGSRDVVNNHIPLDPAGLVRSDFEVVKTTTRSDVSIADLVPYSIRITNTEDIPRVDVDIVDNTPPGFRYVEGTARLDSVEVEPLVDGRELVLQDYDFAANQTRTLTLMLVVGASVNEGVYVNQGFVRDALGAEVSNRGEAAVSVVPDPLFDCSELIGSVYEDTNLNGYQDDGEIGMAGVRLATVNGLLVTTDQDGRYHIACAAIPNEYIGSNFILKLDEQTLPTGYKVTSENPRVVRLTRGKMSKANFGSALENAIRLDITDAAFVGDSNTLQTQYATELRNIVDALKLQRSTLYINYRTQSAQSEARMEELVRQVRVLWRYYGDDYDLDIERRIIRSETSESVQSGRGE